MNDSRGPWYLLTGLLVGIAIGIFYAWNLHPVVYVDTAPASLRSDFKDQYRALIASAYASNGDLVRAKARLDLLHDSDIYRTLAEQAQRTLAEDASSSDARSLGLLAVALGQSEDISVEGEGANLPSIPVTLTPSVSATLNPAASLEPVSTQAAPPTPLPTELISDTLSSAALASEEPSIESSHVLSPTETSPDAALPSTDATAAPLPAVTASPTPGGPFVLSSQDQICDQSLAGPLLQVLAFDQASQPVPGVEVVVIWDGGEEHFFTGLKPELGLGYADFTLTPETVYSLRVGEGGQPVTELSAAECEAPGGEQYWGTWQLKFIQP